MYSKYSMLIILSCSYNSGMPAVVERCKIYDFGITVSLWLAVTYEYYTCKFTSSYSYEL